MEKTDNLHNFAVRLRTTLKRRGLTLEKLANELGVSKSAVGAWTQAKNYPEVQVQQKLAKILGESVEWLVHGNPASLYGGSGLMVTEDPLEHGQSSSRSNEPSAADVRLYLEEYLEEARHVPGGIARMWLELQLHLSLDEIRKLRRQMASRD